MRKDSPFQLDHCQQRFPIPRLCRKRWVRSWCRIAEKKGGSRHLPQLVEGSQDVKERLLSPNRQLLGCLVCVHGRCEDKAEVKVSIHYFKEVSSINYILLLPRNTPFLHNITLFLSVLVVRPKSRPTLCTQSSGFAVQSVSTRRGLGHPQKAG